MNTFRIEYISKDYYFKKKNISEFVVQENPITEIQKWLQPNLISNHSLLKISNA